MNATLLGKTGFGLMVGSWLGFTSVILAQPTANEILAGNFFEPELVEFLQDELKLGDDQKFELKVQMRIAEERMAYLQSQVRKETEALRPLVKNAPVNESAVITQSDKILTLEQDMKRAQLSLLIRIKNQLTPAQLTQLQTIKDKQLALQRKLAQVQEMILKQQADGKSLGALLKFKDKFDPLVETGKLDEAEAVLNQALEFLQLIEHQ